MALLRIDFFSSCLLRNVSISAIIPLDKKNLHGEFAGSSQPLKTLYLLHGIFGNCMDWISETRIQRWAEERNLAVIMPSGDNHFYVDCPGTGERYGEFIGRELVEFTRRMFPLSKKREDTFIAGLSMGGYGALRNGLKYRDVFGCIGGLSSGFTYKTITEKTDEPGQLATSTRSYFNVIFGDVEKVIGSDCDLDALAEAASGAEVGMPCIYLCCGTQDRLLEDNRRYFQLLKNLGFNVKYEEGPGNHEWDFWNRYLKRLLDWLPLDKASSGINSGHVFGHTETED